LNWGLGVEALHQAPRVVRAAGNLPYNVASPILFKLVAQSRTWDAGVPFTDATVMLQREVADRLVAPPGGKEYGVLSVLIQHAADVQLIMKLPPGAFRPAPKVQSALVRLQFHPDEPPVADRALFREMVQAAFTRRRKTTANALLAFRDTSRLSAARALASAGIDGVRRPETLSVAELVRLADVFASANSRPVL
jgi:16S rRNA (adenine1518-N6/adenine1519-N6)-dimethyltransferase